MPPPCQIAHRPIKKPQVGEKGYVGFNPHTQYLSKGDRPFGARAVDCDITVEHDFGIIVRDGCTLYMDIFRPTDVSGPVPAILSYSPFGKRNNGLSMMFAGFLPFACGVTKEDVSGLEKFEGLDPSHWCARGYAIVNVDGRGSGDSDGEVSIMGSQEGEDGHDVVEGIAKLDWCNGNVGLAGNSHLGIVQWFIAQQQPPSLKAIAPWEACSDLYREQFGRGGVFSASNFDFIAENIIQGNKGVEDFAEMYRRTHGGVITPYWADKRANLETIKIPAYITGSEFSGIHGLGSLRGFIQLDTPHKWFRWSATQEWHDIWADKESNDDLQGFFDYFLKGEKNSWPEQTPKVRLSFLQYGGKDPLVNVVVPDFPLPSTDYRKLYFTSENTLVTNASKVESVVSYNSEVDGAMASFRFVFDKSTKLAGLPKAIIYVSNPTSDDFAIAVQLRKLDSNGRTLKNLTIPFSKTPIKDAEECPHNTILVHEGPLGLLRASHRHIDETKSFHPQYPFHPHDRIEKVPPGTPIKLEIGIWPMAIHFEAGESIRVDVSGKNPLWAEVGAASLMDNKGVHKVYIGGEKASHIILPFVDV